MIVKYKPKEDHIKIVPLVPVSKEAKDIKVIRSQLQLLPGVNEVTEDEWLVIKPYLQALIGKEIFPVEKEVPKSKRAPEGTAKNLKEMPSQDAIALVRDCVSPETLTKWYGEESREEIRLLIVEKMKELKMDIPSLDFDKFAGAGGTGNGEKSLDDMSKDELLAYAAEKNISVSGNKGDILAAIKAAQEGAQ